MCSLLKGASERASILVQRKEGMRRRGTACCCRRRRLAGSAAASRAGLLERRLAIFAAIKAERSRDVYSPGAQSGSRGTSGSTGNHYRSRSAATNADVGPAHKRAAVRGVVRLCGAGVILTSVPERVTYLKLE